MMRWDFFSPWPPKITKWNRKQTIVCMRACGRTCVGEKGDKGEGRVFYFLFVVGVGGWGMVASAGNCWPVCVWRTSPGEWKQSSFPGEKTVSHHQLTTCLLARSPATPSGHSDNHWSTSRRKTWAFSHPPPDTAAPLGSCQSMLPLLWWLLSPRSSTLACEFINNCWWLCQTFLRLHQCMSLRGTYAVIHSHPHRIK